MVRFRRAVRLTIRIETTNSTLAPPQSNLVDRAVDARLSQHDATGFAVDGSPASAFYVDPHEAALPHLRLVRALRGADRFC
jgi:hypothetical protein